MKKLKAKELIEEAITHYRNKDYGLVEEKYKQAQNNVGDNSMTILEMSMLLIKLSIRFKKGKASSKLRHANLIRASQLANHARKNFKLDEYILYLGRTFINASGVANSLYLSSMFPLVDEDNQTSLKGVLNSTIEDFVNYGHQLDEKFIKWPYSAVINYSLALNLYYSSPYKTFESHFNPMGVHADMEEPLKKLTRISGTKVKYASYLYERFNKKYPKASEQISNEDYFKA